MAWSRHPDITPAPWLQGPTWSYTRCTLGLGTALGVDDRASSPVSWTQGRCGARGDRSTPSTLGVEWKLHLHHWLILNHSDKSSEVPVLTFLPAANGQLSSH